MTREKKKKLSMVDSEIELFLKKNRIFSKTSKTDISTIDGLSQYTLEMLDAVASNLNNKYVIIQLGIQENHIERFLYTDDTYVFIITDEEKYNHIKQLDYSKYTDLTILFYENGTLIPYV